jgi:hypothetical protein
MACVNQTLLHYVDQMGMTQYKRFLAWRGMAGEQHRHGMVSVN